MGSNRDLSTRVSVAGYYCRAQADIWSLDALGSFRPSRGAVLSPENRHANENPDAPQGLRSLPRSRPGPQMERRSAERSPTA